MIENPPWLEFFKIDDLTLKTWSKDQPETSSLTFWCLKHKKISVKDYLDWARNHYKLASVNDSFFKNDESFLKLFTKYKELSWFEYQLPIAEWEGILFVACVEPSKENWSFPVQFLLTSNENLEKLWLLFKKNRVFPDKKNILMEEKNDTGHKHSHSPLENQQENLENINSEWRVSDSSEKTENLPFGLKKENLIQRGEPNIQKKPISEEKTSREVQKKEKQIITDKENPKAITLEPFSMSSFNDEISDKEILVRWVFEQMNPFFSHCLWFFLKDKHLFCWRHTGNLKPQNPNQWIDYTQPSIFRIVFRTNLPYHGYTTSSAVNDQFFENWGFEAHPEHITAFPIKNNETFVGILMGIGDSNSNTEKALSKTEKIVERINSTLKDLKISIE